MRALVIPPSQLTDGGSYVIEGHAFHHLNVVRVKVGEQLLLLDGQGLKARAILEEVGKKSALARIESIKRVPAPREQDLLLVTPKRDALELMIKMATEVGARNVFLLRGRYSPEKIPERDRLDALVDSALAQSNNAWRPVLSVLGSWVEVPWDQYARVWSFDPSGAKVSVCEQIGARLLVLGPEGGFGPEERALMVEAGKAVEVAFPTPIMRAPTAMAVAWGWSLALPMA